MKTVEIKEQIRELSLDLEVGSTSDRTVCPFCTGGGSNERTFSVTRIAEGLLYNCFRASCPTGRGFIGSRNVVSDYNAKKREFQPRPYTRPLHKLPAVLRQWLQSRFSLTEEHIEDAGFKYDPSTRRVYMPVHDARGYEVGAVARSYCGDKPKTIVYWFNDVPKFHFPPRELSGYSVVLVEDIISAMRCSRIENTVALLGTGFNAEQAGYLRSMGFSNIVYALDPDAITTAIKLHNKYKLLFDTSRVVLLSADPKDLPHDQLKKELEYGKKDNKRLHTA